LKHSALRWLCCALALLVGGQALARSPADEAEREQRRLELRRQLEGERGRWGGPARGGEPPGYRAPHHGMPPGHGGPRMTPDERRALRRELREQRP
jgi:hypothetical protein